MLARTLRITLIRETALAAASPRVEEVCRQFGVARREEPRTIARRLRVELRPGQIVLVMGPSGAGKTALLGAIAEQCPGAIRVAGRMRGGQAVVDGVAPRQPVGRALQLL